MVLGHWRKLGDVDLFTSCEYMLQIIKIREIISDFVSSYLLRKPSHILLDSSPLPSPLP